ncbi:hypothetical protein CKALI_01145 [Corynebacterium kalinowskii]|uniref:Uncharacterized protein n=1 Tax=Corynebacterium kalinowskii TaxID=2675216 RepID=A0A6B8VDI8_9CORY|nr:hypothetical protein [Corynebacterium kalinowskii]QGU01129.1 hypothetical protein CKALI_01145 [Corynebacterium kalinowskii]
MGESALQRMRAHAMQFRSDPAVCALIERSREVPRVGACTLEVPLSITLSDAHSVHLTWPAIGVDVDVIFLVHDGPLDAKTRDRIAVGPAEFVVVPAVTDIPMAWDALDPERLELARARSLWQGLAGLGLQPPEMPELTAGQCSAVVIGPEEDDRLRVAALLAAAGIVVESGFGADVVVAVAPKRGWDPQDYPRLEAAFARVGRMVITAPLPRSVCGEAVVASEEEAVAEVRRQAQLPPLAPLPEVNPAAWERCAHRLERQLLVARPALIDALVITFLVGVGLIRVLPVGVAVVLALLLGVLRLVRAQLAGEPLLRLSGARSRGVWLRRKMAGLGWG